MALETRRRAQDGAASGDAGGSGSHAAEVRDSSGGEELSNARVLPRRKGRYLGFQIGQSIREWLVRHAGKSGLQLRGNGSREGCESREVPGGKARCHVTNGARDRITGSLVGGVIGGAEARDLVASA